MIAPTYYRSRLNSAEQEIYKTVVNGLLCGNPTIRLQQSTNPMGTIQKAVHAVHLDHPELFYVDFWHYQFIQSASPRGWVLQFRLMLDNQSAVAVMNTMAERAAALQAKIQGRPSREEAYVLVAKEIASSTRYLDSNSAFWDHTAAGPVLRHSGVCEGISKLFLFFCQRLKLPCAMMTGTVDDTPHAWNMVEVLGVRKYIDVTGLLHNLAGYTGRPGNLLMSEQRLQSRGYQWEDSVSEDGCEEVTEEQTESLHIWMQERNECFERI